MKHIYLIFNFIISLYTTVLLFTTYDRFPEFRNNQVYIIADYGVCLDSYGNGQLYGYNDEFNYISYRNIKDVKEGDKIYTFCILNPKSNECDDIICRIDIVEGINKIFVDLDDKYIISEIMRRRA